MCSQQCHQVSEDRSDSLEWIWQLIVFASSPQGWISPKKIACWLRTTLLHLKASFYTVLLPNLNTFLPCLGYSVSAADQPWSDLGAHEHPGYLCLTLCHLPQKSCIALSTSLPLVPENKCHHSTIPELGPPKLNFADPPTLTLLCSPLVTSRIPLSWMHFTAALERENTLFKLTSKLFFKMYLLYCVCMNILPTHMYVYRTCAWCPQRSRGEHGILWHWSSRLLRACDWVLGVALRSSTRIIALTHRDLSPSLNYY